VVQTKYASQLFLLGEGNDYSFSKALVAAGIIPRFVSNLENNYVAVKGATTYTEVNAMCLHDDERVVRAVQNARVRNFAWNFPFVGSAKEISYIQESLLLSTLQSLVLLQRKTQQSLTVAFALQGDQFSRVECLAISLADRILFTRLVSLWNRTV
jgi:hypothetical protein